mgnify:CR=1 FL=1
MTISQFIYIYAQPFIDLATGLLIFGIVATFNWYGDLKQRTINWLALRLYGTHPFAKQSALSVFMVITAYATLFSGILVIVALLFITNGEPI